MVELSILQDKKGNYLKASVIENDQKMYPIWNLSRPREKWVELIKDIWKSNDQALLNVDCPILGKLANIKLDNPHDTTIKNMVFGKGNVRGE